MEREGVGRPGDSGITKEREDWVHRCLVAGKQAEAVAWMESSGDFANWTDRRGRTVAARLLGILGDERASKLLHLRNFRQYPNDPVAIFYGVFRVYSRLGALAALELLTSKLDAAGSRARGDADYAGMWAHLGWMQAYFRDFSRAHESLDQASALDPDDMWIEVQRSHILLREDRPEESLEVAEAAMKKTPHYWAVVGTVADLYWAANRDEDALSLLKLALTTNDGAGPAQQLASCLDEIEAWEEGLAALQEFEKRSPRADKATRKWLEGYRASFLYQLGRGQEMIPHAEAADQHFYNQVVERVKSGAFAQGRRVRLDVKFVRQNEMTCAPATLTALSHYFGREASHLAVAEEICYDGTPDFKERCWAEQQGWVVREFCADWDATRRLIDAGFPFALATVEPTSAHLQAVIGYDSRAGTLIIRDPGQRHYQESLEIPFFEGYAHCGPRAMALSPPERAKELREIELPDEAEYDLIYRLNGALEVHDRDAAVARLNELEALAPDHRLLDHGRFILSCYDSDSRSGYEVAKRMMQRFPGSVRWEYACYRRRVERMTREERLTFLREKIREEKVFTHYYKELADVLSEDARCHAEARYYYRRALRFRGADAEVYYGLAGVLWSQRQFRQATFLYRLAASLADKDEANAESYFKACRWVRETEPALEVLKERVKRLGSGSGGPAITLCNALNALSRRQEMATVLDEALEARPDDGELISFAANHFAEIRQMDRARQLVERSRGRISETARLRLTARLASLDSRPEEALAAWRSVLEREPLAMDGHRAVANLLARTTGATAASIAHLRAACEAFPHHVPLHETLIGWLRDEGPGQAEPVLRRLLQNHDSNAWAWRELALELADQQRFDEGLEAATRAIELRPDMTASHSIHGWLHELKRDMAAAAAGYRRALELDVENGSSMSGLVRVSDGGAAKREALRFIEGQLAEQVLFGEGMHRFRDTAFPILEPEELLEALRRANEARPDLWETWSALTDQLVAMSRLDEALLAAEQLTMRFPMMPRAWLNLAEVHRHRGDVDLHIKTLERCVALNPQWTRALRELAEALERRGDFDKAVELLEGAVHEAPQEAVNLGCLADLLWKMGRRDEAFETLSRAVRVDPDYGWAWDAHADWARLLDREADAIAEGERLVGTLPMRYISWERLATVHGKFNRVEKRIETLDRGLERLPQSEELRDQKAWVLCRAGRYEAALAECGEDLWPNGVRPRMLAAREAWIENELGRTEEAIVKMSIVAEHHPDYYWAHEQLTEWYQRDEKWEEALRQAKHLVRLAPMSPVSHGMLADLYLKRGNTAAALPTLQRAMELDPAYAYAAVTLTRLHLDERRFDEAETSLTVLEYQHPDNANTVEMRCRLELGRRRPEPAAEVFAKLCRMPRVGVETLERVEASFDSIGESGRILCGYRAALESGEVRSDAVARRWVGKELKRWGAVRRIEKLLGRTSLLPEVAEGAWQELIYELDRRKANADAQSVIRRNKGIFRGNSILWASAAYVLRQGKRFRQVNAWMSDWQEREGVRPWMLINLAFAKLRLKGIGGAGPVHLYAATALPEDHETWLHHAGAAYYEIWQGRVTEARTHLAKAEMAELRPLYRAICRLTEFRIVLSETGRADGAIFRRAVEAFPEWVDDRSARTYFFDVYRHAGGALLFRSGGGWFALGQWLKAVGRTREL